jgi:hypothetical protein
MMIANKVIEDRRVEHALQVNDGSTGDSAQEIEALLTLVECAVKPDRL